jgi:hypothetical protein
MKKSLLTLMTLLNVSLTYSQVNNNDPLVSDGIHSISASTFDVYYRYEHAIAKTQTLFAEIGVGSNIAYRQDETDTYRWGLALYPSAGVGYRNSYNIQKRANAGKKTGYNSANYFGANIVVNPLDNFYRSKHFDESTQSAFEASVVWGLRRQLGKSFTFDFNVGPKISNVTFKDNVDVGFIHVQWRFAYNF